MVCSCVLCCVLCNVSCVNICFLAKFERFLLSGFQLILWFYLLTFMVMSFTEQPYFERTFQWGNLITVFASGFLALAWLLWRPINWCLSKMGKGCDMKRKSEGGGKFDNDPMADKKKTLMCKLGIIMAIVCMGNIFVFYFLFVICHLSILSFLCFFYFYFLTCLCICVSTWEECLTRYACIYARKKKGILHYYYSNVPFFYFELCNVNFMWRIKFAE